jgi:hypothetical protein
MKIKPFLKFNIIAPLSIGIIVGGILFFYGEIDDSPGLCLIAVVLCLSLLYLGLRNASKINKKASPHIVLPLLIGITSIIWIIGYFVAGVYDEPPGLILIGIIISIALISLGILNIRKMNKKRK